MLRSLEISVPGATYAVIMLFTGFAFALWSSAQMKEAPARRSPSGAPPRMRSRF
jgi:hypothetical protein